MFKRIGKFIGGMFSPAGDTTTPEQAARIAAARQQNETDFGDGALIARELGMNEGERDQAVRAYRQLRKDGRWNGTLAEYMEHRQEVQRLGQ